MMNAKRILFPTDFSSLGDSALELASSLARDMDAKLLIVHVEEPPSAYAGEFYYGLPEPETEKLLQTLREVVPTDPRVGYEHLTLQGEPSSEIIRCAKREKADMIVMGTHGRRGLSRVMMGSVAEAVVRRAPCPVLTYKQTADQKTGFAV